MAFSQQFLDELRLRAGIADIVGRRVQLTRKGREQQGLCPFHKEKTPSFYVYDDHYHCFGCGAHGSAIDFAMQTENLSFPEAVRRLAEEAGMEVPEETPQEREREKEKQTLYDVMEAAAAYFEKCLRMPEGKRALDYLRGRGLDQETITRFRLGFAPSAGDGIKGALARRDISEELMLAGGLIIRPEDEARSTYARFRDRVMFPIADRRARVVAFGGRILGDGEPKYLNSPETALFHKGRMLYNLALAAPAARDSGRLIVSEGYMDVIALSAAGFEDAVAPLGTALSEQQMMELWRLVREPVLCLDGDEAGRRAAARAAERALVLLRPGYALRFAMLPPGEDPDTLIRRDGAEAMERVLGGAVPLSEVLWRMETGGAVPRTPEERAALQKRMYDHARKIADPTIRSHFSRWFGDRIWARRETAGRVPGMTPSMRLEGAAGVAARLDPAGLRERILLSVLITHPDLYSVVDERLGSMTFSAPELDKLRAEVLKTLAEGAGLDSGALVNHLRGCGYSKALDVLLSAAVYNHAYFARPETSPEEALRGWEEAFGQLTGRELQVEIEQALRDLAENPSEETMNRLRALKQLQHHSAPGGEDDEGPLSRAGRAGIG